MEMENIEYDFEEWEADSYFIDKEDWKGLLELRKKRDLNRLDDLHAQERYSEALIYNNLYSEAIDFLKPLYKEHYDIGFGIHGIIQSLKGLGKTEEDFPWISKPNIVKLDKKMIQLCIDLLKGKRKPTSVIDIYGHFLVTMHFIDFNTEALGLFLLEENKIFDNFGDKTDTYGLEFKLKRK